MLFTDVLGRHLKLYYENPGRCDIPTYAPIDQSIMESKVLNIYPVMNKFSNVPCFNFPIDKPSFKNGFTSFLYAKHDRIIVSVLSGTTCDTLMEATPLVTAAIIHTAAYLTYQYKRQRGLEASFIAGFNEMRTTHIPGYSGMSMHQICNIMQFSSTSPSSVTRSMLLNAYRDRISYRLPPEERVHGVCQHSIDLNIQVDTTPQCQSFLSSDLGRLTNTKSCMNPVAAGAMVIDMLVAADMAGMFVSFQISHTIPLQIRKAFMPVFIEELRTLQFLAYDISHRK